MLDQPCASRGRHGGLFKNLSVFRGLGGTGHVGRHAIFGTCARQRGQRCLYVPACDPLGPIASTACGRSTSVLATIGNLNPAEVKKPSRLRGLRLPWVQQRCETRLSLSRSMERTMQSTVKNFLEYEPNMPPERRECGRQGSKQY